MVGSQFVVEFWDCSVNTCWLSMSKDGDKGKTHLWTSVRLGWQLELGCPTVLQARYFCSFFLVDLSGVNTVLGYKVSLSLGAFWIRLKLRNNFQDFVFPSSWSIFSEVQFSSTRTICYRFVHWMRKHSATSHRSNELLQSSSAMSFFWQVIERFHVFLPFLWTVSLHFFLRRQTALLLDRDVHKWSWSWENMHLEMKQSRKRREKKEESVIRESTKEFDLFVGIWGGEK